MKLTSYAHKRALQCGMALALCLFAGSISANAAEVSFQGTAQGGFNSSPSNTSSLAGLTYYGANFQGTTAGGGLAFGGNAVASFPNQDNFGAVTLTASDTTYNDTLTLLITFALPSGIASGNPA